MPKTSGEPVCARPHARTHAPARHEVEGIVNRPRNSSHPLGSPRLRRDARRGAVLLYSIVLLVGLIAVSSLAVDYALVQSSKTQLVAAVDAAARCAVKKLAMG